MDALSVSEVNALIKTLFDGDEILSRVLVCGELSAYKIYPSGHHYFSLKDEGGLLRCVMFKGDASKLGFRLSDGMRVLAAGRITVYPRDGQYQLYCQRLIPDGAGALQMAFEELKRRLEAEGLFDVQHKKPLPSMPGRIVLITSPAGAAVRDMIRILGRRWPLAEVILAPVRVQGEESPGEIAAALRYANARDMGDLIIVGRGGGSPEDLLAFNDERVARAIFASHIPVISAVGHEPDVTIADFVADLRAATPSHAAEMAVPDLDDWRRRLHGARERLAALAGNRIRLSRMRVEPFARAMVRPERIFAAPKQRIDRLAERLWQAWQTAARPRHLWLADKSGRLSALSPRNVLKRGYAVALNADGKALRSPADAPPGQEIRIILYKGSIKARVEEESHETNAQL